MGDVTQNNCDQRNPRVLQGLAVGSLGGIYALQEPGQTLLGPRLWGQAWRRQKLLEKWAGIS